MSRTGYKLHIPFLSSKMDEERLCFICQDFEKNVGHSTKSCPENICKKCGISGSDLQCLFKKICYTCQEFETNAGHETISCSKANICWVCQDFKMKIWNILDCHSVRSNFSK